MISTKLPLVWTEPSISYRQVLGSFRVQFVQFHSEPRETVVKLVVFGHSSFTNRNECHYQVSLLDIFRLYCLSKLKKINGQTELIFKDWIIKHNMWQGMSASVVIDSKLCPILEVLFNIKNRTNYHIKGYLLQPPLVRIQWKCFVVQKNLNKLDSWMNWVEQ